MKVLITGGAGFIGSHLAEELLRRGHAVHALDDLSTGSMANIDHLKSYPDFQFTRGTILDEPLLARMIDESDAVYHLAAAVGVRLILEDPVSAIQTNVCGTETVLRLSAARMKRLVIASTSEVYGNAVDKAPSREDQGLVIGATSTPRWSYACSKAVGEFLAFAYWKQKRLPVTVVRLFNAAGPRQLGKYGMVIPTLVGQALGGVPLTVFGDGAQTRCFACVDEVVAAMAELLARKASYGLAVNIGSTEEISILELAQRIKAMTRSESPIVLVPYAEAYDQGFEDIVRRIPDLSVAKRLIGYEHRTPLSKIIQGIVDAMSASPKVARAL